MSIPDPASLQNLNPVIPPAAVDAWPLAPGWYAVIALLLIIASGLVWQQIQRWRANRYRRAALQALNGLQQQLQLNPSAPGITNQLPQLLKRTALAAYPRIEVASLYGDSWFKFLNRTTPSPLFSTALATEMQNMAYAGIVNARSSADLIDSCARWIRLHRPEDQILQGESNE